MTITDKRMVELWERLSATPDEKMFRLDELASALETYLLQSKFDAGPLGSYVVPNRLIALAVAELLEDWQLYEANR